MENENEIESVQNDVAQNEQATEPVEAAQEVTEKASAETPKDRLMQRLDAIGEPEQEEVVQEAKAEPVEKTDEHIQQKAESEPVAKMPDQEEAEILEEVKSERGQNRIREILNERKELREINQSLSDVVKSTNMSPEEFANTMQFCRLVSSDNEHDLRVAFNMLEEQRVALCKRMGMAAPGIDPLDDFPYLREKVDLGEMPEQEAIRLAKYERAEQQRHAEMQRQQVFQRQQQEYTQHVSSFQEQANIFFNARMSDIDYKAREQRLTEYFRKPGVLESFVQTYEPHQWLPQLQFLYENVSVPEQPKQTPQPLRSRPTVQGSFDSSLTGADRILSKMDAMGL